MVYAQANIFRVDDDGLKCIVFFFRFHERFVTNMSFSVRFTFSRTPLKLMHRAIEMPSGFLSQLPSVRDPQVCGKREVKRLR